MYIKHNNNIVLTREAKRRAFEDMTKDRERNKSKKGSSTLVGRKLSSLNVEAFFSILPNQIIYPIEILKDKV